MLEMLHRREYSADFCYALRKTITSRRSRSLLVSLSRDVQCKHRGGVVTLCLDGAENRYLLSGGSDGQIGIYDMFPAVNSLHYTHPAICFIDKEHKDAHKTSISSVMWYPHDSGMFLSCATDNLLKVWDTNALVAVEQFTFSGIAYCVDMSPVAVSHSLAAVATGKSQVILVDLKAGSQSHTLRGHQGAALCLNWSRDNEFIIASGGEDGRVFLWDIRRSHPCLLVLDRDNHKNLSSSVQSTYKAHKGRVNGLHFTADGRRIITMGTDYRLRAWDAMTGRRLSAHFGHHDNQSRRCVQIACAEDVIYAPEGADIQAYDVISGDQVTTLSGHFTTSNCCIYNESRQELYSGSNDRNILIFTADNEKDLRYKEYVKTMSEQRKDTQELGATMADDWSSDDDSDNDGDYNPG